MQRFKYLKWTAKVSSVIVIAILISFYLVPINILADTGTNDPTANTGAAWTNPANAYTNNGGDYASITSGAPSDSNVWGNYGFSLTGDNITQVRVRYDAWSAGAANNPSNKPTANTNGSYPWTNPANAYDAGSNQYATAVATIPTWRSTGTMGQGTTSAVTIGLPGSMVANDIVILVACCYTGGTLAITTAGSISTWTPLANTPVDVALGDKLYVWWGRWASGTTGVTLTPTSADHFVGRTVAYSACYAGGSPIDVSAVGTEALSDVTYSFVTGLSTSYNNEICISICTTTYDPPNDSTTAFGTMTNANLANIAERMDNDVKGGNGGGFGLDEGSLIINGQMGTFASTLANASPKAYIAFALLSTNPGNTFDQIYNSFGFTGTQTITKVEIGYEAFATATQKLTIYDSVNGGSAWTSHLVTLVTSDPNAYTYIDITADYAPWDWTKLNNTNFKIKIATTWANGTPTWSVDNLVVRITSTTEYDDQIRVDVSWDAGSHWTSTQNTALTSAEVTTWYDVTALAGGWTPAKLANGQLQVRALAYTVNTAEVVRLDWLPVEVTYSIPTITDNPNSKAWGTVNLNASSSTTINYFTLTNTGTCDVSITIQGTSFTGGDDTWTLSNDATNGDNVYGLKAGLDDADDNFDIIVKGATNTLASYLVVSGTQCWGLWILMPSAVTGYNNQQMTATVTLVASSYVP